MARQSRFIVPGSPHHITQRGNRKQTVFFEDSDRKFYLRTLMFLAPVYGVDIFAYCLMTNHSHLGLIPSSAEGLSNMMKSLHSKYAARINRRFGWSGHLWQQRFFSSPLDAVGFKTVLGYIELNPVRASMVKRPEDHEWSSARSHVLNLPDPEIILNNELAARLVKNESWEETFYKSCDYSSLRKSHRRNFPFGANSFIDELELRTGRTFHPLKRGPKIK